MGVFSSKVVWGGTEEENTELVVPITLADKDVTIPHYATAGASGMELYASRRVELDAGAPTFVDTGVAMALPFFLFGQILQGPGLALENFHVHPSVVDSDFRGQIQVLMSSCGGQPYIVEKGDRVAQLLVLPVARPGMLVVEALPPPAQQQQQPAVAQPIDAQPPPAASDDDSV